MSQSRPDYIKLSQEETFTDGQVVREDKWRRVLPPLRHVSEGEDFRIQFQAIVSIGRTSKKLSDAVTIQFKLKQNRQLAVAVQNRKKRENREVEVLLSPNQAAELLGTLSSNPRPALFALYSVPELRFFLHKEFALLNQVLEKRPVSVKTSSKRSYSNKYTIVEEISRPYVDPEHLERAALFQRTTFIYAHSKRAPIVTQTVFPGGVIKVEITSGRRGDKTTFGYLSPESLERLSGRIAQPWHPEPKTIERHPSSRSAPLRPRNPDSGKTAVSALWPSPSLS